MQYYLDNAVNSISVMSDTIYRVMWVKALICPGDGIKVIKVGAWRYPASGTPARVIRNSV